jgi:hypothetical protein
LPQVTLVAPWVPSSSRAAGFGGLLALLGGWTPVPLLQAFVGLTNSRVVAQVGGIQLLLCAAFRSCMKGCKNVFPMCLCFPT